MSVMHRKMENKEQISILITKGVKNIRGVRDPRSIIRFLGVICCFQH